MPNYEIATEAQWKKLPKRNAAYWNNLEPGKSIGIRVGAKGEYLWHARLRTDNDRYLSTTLGTAGSGNGKIGYAEAVAAAHAWFATDDVRSRTFVPHTIRYDGQLTICPWGDKFTVGHAFRDYLEWKRIAAARSHFSAVVTLINHHLVPRIANIPLSQFLARDFHKLCVDVLETPPKRGNQPPGQKLKIEDMSPEALRCRKKTMNALTSILRGAFTLAWQNGEIESDKPIRCLQHLPNIDLPRSVFLSRLECTALINASRPDLRQLILGALYTGCRVQELANLRVRDVAREGFGIYVSPSKNYRPRFVFLPEEGLAFFLAACRGKSGDDFVFLNQQGRRWSDLYKHLFRRLIDGLDAVPANTVFHSLRHTYASQLVQAGASFAVVAKQLGHANISTVDKIYGHLAPNQTEQELAMRFAPLDLEFVEQAAASRQELDDIRARFRGDHRLYATIEGQRSWPRSNFSKFTGSVLSQLPR